ncbi:MAG: FAD-dependent oxidoreductase [Candidatus Melainabacteria bacterium]|nr:FAD-dependent oxidoreductase [Candidatus Melainabacteria bacterium]
MPKLELTYKELPPCDVLVAGGGSAGVSAAVSAGRSGAKTVLIEKSTFLGGMATGALVTPMMKNALDAKNILTKGLFLEACERLVKAGGGATFKDGNPGWFNPEIYKWVLDEMCIEAGVKLMFENHLVSAEIINKEIKKVFFINKSGCFSICAKEFIDCTGDADLVTLSGISYESGKDNARQAMSLRFMMSNIDLRTFAKWLQENDKSGDSPVYFLDNGDILLSSAYTFEKDWTLKSFFEAALKNKDLKKEDAAYFQIFSVPGSPGLIAFNCPRLTPENKTLDPLNNEDTSWVLVQGRQMIKRISAFCKKYLPGFSSSYVCQIAPNIGVRESRRLIGQYVLTANDVLNGKKFEDSVANSNWPIDIHPSNINEKGQLRHPPKDDYYQIPLRSLLPKENEIKNLIVAGRCLSATFEAQGSARIQANCWAMGEAAGLLASKRIKEPVTKS